MAKQFDIIQRRCNPWTNSNLVQRNVILSVFGVLLGIGTGCNPNFSVPSEDSGPPPVLMSASATPTDSDSDEIDMSPPPPSTPDESAGEDTPRRVLARIQGNLERVAAGERPAPPRHGATAHALEGLVDVFAALMKGDADVDTQLEAVEAKIMGHLSEKVQEAFPMAERKKGGSIVKDSYEAPAYEALLLKILKGAPRGPKGHWIRFAALMRATDATLVMAGASFPLRNQSFSLFSRTQLIIRSESESYRDDAFLRIPCRALPGRVKLLEEAYKKLGRAAGVLMGCPVAQGKEVNWALMERFASDPAAVAKDVLPKKAEEKPRANQNTEEPTPPPLPWNEGAALVFMAENPDEADRVLRKGSSARAKLDRLLFLHALRPASKERDGQIQKLKDDIDKASMKAIKSNPDDASLAEMEELTPISYDGSDESLLPTLRLASSVGVASTVSSFYAIPCAILVAKPALMKSAEPLFGGNRDNFLPRSGCAWGIGFVKGFPDAEFEAYRSASQEPDGNFYMNFSGTMKFGLASHQQAFVERFRVDPKSVLNQEDSPAPTFDEPYLVWSYLSLENRAAFMRVVAKSSALREKLLAHLQKRGLSAQEAKDATRQAIFEGVWGASCGNNPPKLSLRKLLIEKASTDEISGFIQRGEYKNMEALEAFTECARYASMDPLVHVAVGHPASLPILWEKLKGISFREAQELDVVIDANRTNEFGKTPLMAAAQANQLESIRFLLKNGADVNWATRKRGEPWLRHDARTALMYAASRGSPALIQALLDAGADKFASDTRGFRAIHYLLGHGPTPPNPVLTAEEQAEAAKRLY